MTGAIVECVPNFSEGRDSAKIKQITDAIEAVQGAKLLSVEPGADTNRTVVTFVGSPQIVAEAAFQAIKKAAQVLDMSTHHGTHPRMGATDVCPFIPVRGVSMQTCIEIARNVGARVGRELEIPVYLYEEATTRLERKNLADIRKGEYEALAQKLTDPNWTPDFGPAKFNAKSGATVIGAREFLIAYNINLNSTDKAHAAELAYELRERGRVARAGNTKPYYARGTQLVYSQDSYPCGSCQFVAKTYAETKNHCQKEHGYDLDALLISNDIQPSDVIGKKVYRPGKFNQCKAIGWYVADYRRSQISINLTNYEITSAHDVLEETRSLAASRGLVVTGSEVVGVIPFQALLNSGKYYLQKQGKTTGFPVQDILRTAVLSLGLSDVAPFEIEKKVIGLPERPDNALVNMSISEFTDEVSRDTPAPGGGSIAALAGALGAALASMVANLTHGKEGTESRDPDLSRIAEKAQELKDQLMRGVDDDTNAFNAYMDARRLPKDTNEEKNIRLQKMQEGLKIAIEVPWKTATASFEAMQIAREVASIGNPNSITDAAVGVQIAFAGVRGGIWNVLINLKDITDVDYIQTMQDKCKELLGQATPLTQESGDFIDKKIFEMISKSQSRSPSR